MPQFQSSLNMDYLCGMKRLIGIFAMIFSSLLYSQDSIKLKFLEPSPSFNDKRFWTVSGIGTGIFAGTIVGLNEIWYAQYPRSSFQLFNDWGEWKGMDKLGHTMTAYGEARYLYGGARWCGLSDRRATWTAVGVASGLQLSLEMLDAYSSEWGFSLPDVAFNTLGVSVFLAQQLYWQEQRILLKWGNFPVNYPADIFVTSTDGSQQSSVRDRARNLYGSNYVVGYFKDYNAASSWVSLNLKSFMPDSKFPPWLNVAVGYGAQNMLGGYRNEWTNDNGQVFNIPAGVYPRYQQYFLSLDIDMTRLRVRNRYLRTLLYVLNSVKVPLPGIEYNSLGQWKFHPFMF